MPRAHRGGRARRSPPARSGAWAEACGREGSAVRASAQDDAHAAAPGAPPQLSALTANTAPRAVVGSVLTLVNSLGVAISTPTIVLLVHPPSIRPLHALLPWLAVGPVIGVWCLRPLWR